MPAGLCGLHGIVDYRGGIAALLRDDRHVVAFAPGRQLLPGSGTKRVACRKQHRQALPLQVFSQLADRGGLARAVHPHHHDHKRFMGFGMQRLRQRLEQPEQAMREGLLEFGRFAQSLFPDLMAQVGEQCVGRVQAGHRR